MKLIKFSRRWFVILVFVTTMSGSFHSRLGGQILENTLAPRLEFGVDDGFACVFFYGCDIAGNLETCG